MAKQGGLGDLMLVGGVDLSGDVGAIDRIGGGPAALEMPGIDVSAQERYGALRDGSIAWSSWFNPTRAHPQLSTLPTTDVGVAYGRGRLIGSPGAILVAKQIGYNGNRQPNGAFAFGLDAESNGYGLDWGRQLTAGLRVDSADTDGASLDLTDASTLFGWQAFLSVTALAGGNLTVTIADSADDSAFAALTGGAFTQVTVAPAWERLQGGRTATVRRYLRVSSSGTFTSATFNVIFVRNVTAVAF